ncbi:hypothetical protein AS029_06145 [Microbacterium enclense]|nr:hypothetical protein AS029_06145 [Microbacterium enclense]
MGRLPARRAVDGPVSTAHNLRDVHNLSGIPPMPAEVVHITDVVTLDLSIRETGAWRPMPDARCPMSGVRHRLEE